MPYLTTAELQTHLYGEVTAEINRSDSDTTNSDTAIAAAIEEASGYLAIFDTTAIFAATGANRNPAVLMYIKDIAVWHFLQLSNPGVEMELRESRYDKAVRYFSNIQKGFITPNLPYPAPVVDSDGNTVAVETSVTYNSVFPKRTNNF